MSLIEDEARENPRFGRRLEALLVQPHSAKAPSAGEHKKPPEVPDVFEAFARLGEEEFRFWLRDLDAPTLKAIIRANGYDPQERVRKWKDPDKFVELIVEQTKARRNRGSAFLNPRKGH